MMKEWVMGILAILNLRIKLKIILDVIDSSDQKRKFTIITTRNSSCGKVLMFFTSACHSFYPVGGGVYPIMPLANHSTT